MFHYLSDKGKSKKDYKQKHHKEFQSVIPYARSDCLLEQLLNAVALKIDYLFSASADLMYLASSSSETWKFCISPEKYWS